MRGSGEVVGRRSRRGVGGAAVLVGGVLTMFASAVQADTYQCTTEDGRKLSAATRPVECDGRPTHRIRSNGSEMENVNKRYDADAQLLRELVKPRKPPVGPPLGGK